MNASEPLMRCRNAYRCCQNLSSGAIQGSVWRLPFSCPGGNRHKEGMNLIQALAWNLGTCRSDVKRESQAEAPWSERVSMRTSDGRSGAEQAKPFEMLWLDDRSRMRREPHVRFCESFWGQFLGATRLLTMHFTSGELRRYAA